MSNYRQQFENLQPEEVKYVTGALVVRERLFPCENAQLAYIEALEEWMERNTYETLKTGTRLHIDTVYGDNLSIGCNCSIGGFGFGYKPDGQTFKRMPHHGHVVLGDNVTIHNNVNIDRAVTGVTKIGNGTAIDSGVHIAHNAQIGDNVLIAANATIGGSAIIENNVFIGCNAFIKQKVRIGAHAVVGAGSVVLKDIPPHAVVAGVPAKPIK